MKLKFLVLLLISVITLNAQQVLDQIVAVVDNEIILKSELDFQVSLFAAQNKIDPDTPGLRDKLLDDMIESKLVLAQANLDSITVTENEVNQRIDYQVQMFEQQYGSRQKVEQIYGMSIERIKRELREDVEKNIMTQKLQEKKFGAVEASKREVEEFYGKYKDSLGIIPEKVQIAHIFRNPKASDRLKKKAFDFASAILDSIKQGSDFAELAKKYSEDPVSAAEGGDLGFVKRGVFYPEFESAAFALGENQLSGVVESPVGYHIIQMLERRGESIHTRHILVKIKADEQADLNTIEFLTELRDSIVKGTGTFSEFAAKYSEDQQTKPFGGELGTFYLNQLDKNLLDITSKLKEEEISYPRRVEYGQGIYGYHIVYLKSRTKEHTASLVTDFNELKRLADEYKKQELYQKWIDELKGKIYWEVRS
jgi:peptidyl-prolyl cis-trans isomerase SurA